MGVWGCLLLSYSMASAPSSPQVLRIVLNIQNLSILNLLFHFRVLRLARFLWLFHPLLWPCAFPFFSIGPQKDG